ncbi:hypothetical protein [Phytohabitans houttuyneae]|uniref:Uncharacterized protein n=1 Tax=Phytohabitans houttuyneae TaxID=1076126 RepID=A0A6V8KCC2_9ACTN|nr:hypothetical protein [Phytohabitans houttuyneae]GFJ80081.1 hypothetical protein Phou_042610 [Phytohabitans houttuyneae]
MSLFDFNPNHTAWCARDHQCGTAGEHRATPIGVDVHGHGRGSLTRVRDADGREYAEIRVRVALSPVEPYAHRQLGTLLTGLRTLLIRTARAGYPAPPYSTRRAA